MNIEALLLFIYQTALLKDIEYINDLSNEYMISYQFGPEIIDQIFIRQLNIFLEKTYKENKKTLEIIFNNIPLLDDFIKGNYEILDYESILKISDKYKGIEGYLHLVDSLDIETNQKLNDLTISFIEYYKSLINLANEKYTGYKKILQ